MSAKLPLKVTTAVAGLLACALLGEAATAQDVAENKSAVAVSGEAGSTPRVADGEKPVALAQGVTENKPVAAIAAEAASTPKAAESGKTGAQRTNEVEEIIVTARRVAENLMKVPLAVSVMSAANIETTGVKSLGQLAQFTPGLFVKPTGSGSNQDRSLSRLIFRGLSTSEGTIFIDGAPFAGAGAPDVTDVARIEVLNGPQSVYFGRATFAGATNYVTKTPNDEFGARVTVEGSSYNSHETSLMVEGPLIKDLLSVRVNARDYKFGGAYKNGLTGTVLGSQSTKSASIAAVMTPSANLKLTGYYSYSLDDDGPPEIAAIRAYAPGAALFNCDLGGTGGKYWCGPLPSVSDLNKTAIGDYSTMDAFTRRELVDNVRGSPVPFDTHWLQHFGLKRSVNHAHARVDWSLGSGWESSFLTAYSRSQFARIIGQLGSTSDLVNTFHPATAAALAAACAAPAGSTANAACFSPEKVQLTTFQQNIVNDLSQELRFTSPQDNWLRATFGASYYRVWGPSSSNFGIQNSGRLINGGNGGLISRVHTPAVFGGVYVDATDKLKLGIEGRYQWDGITRQQTFPAASPQLDATFKSFSPRITADYSVTPQSLLYGSYSWGYRPGGFNAALQGLPDSVLAQFGTQGTQISYKEEKLVNYEIGNKATWFDKRLRTTLALYYMKYTNGQVPNVQFFVNPNGSTGSTTVITNVGEVNLKGIELQADLKATENLKFSGSLGLADNKIINYVYTPNGLRIRNSTAVNGNTLDGVPKLVASLSPTYTQPLTPDWNGSLRIDLLYRSKVYTDPTNVAWTPARGLVNARMSFVNQGNLKIDLFVKNLLNNDTLTSAVKTNDGIYAANGACPPCSTATRPPLIAAGVSTLSLLFLGLPERRTFGLRASYDF